MYFLGIIGYLIEPLATWLLKSPSHLPAVILLLSVLLGRIGCCLCILSFIRILLCLFLPKPCHIDVLNMCYPLGQLVLYVTKDACKDLLGLLALLCRLYALCCLLGLLWLICRCFIFPFLDLLGLIRCFVFVFILNSLHTAYSTSLSIFSFQCEMFFSNIFEIFFVY